MVIDFESQIQEMTSALEIADDYLKCERIIILNVRKHLKNEFDDKVILEFLEKLSGYFRDIIEMPQNTGDCANYHFAEGFVNMLIKMPYWKTWVQTINT